MGTGKAVGARAVDTHWTSGSGQKRELPDDPATRSFFHVPYCMLALIWGSVLSQASVGFAPLATCL